MNIEKQYLENAEYILKNGEKREDRTGTGTLSVFGLQMRHDFKNGFPLLTTKEVDFEVIKAELFTFLAGDTNAEDFARRGMKIWRKWAKPDGDLGPIYGKQWRSWTKYRHTGRESGGMEEVEIIQKDQILDTVERLKNDRYSRRHVVSAWNVADLSEMQLEPCHVLFQFYVHNDDRLSLQLYQRSADWFLGVPYNIASYAALLNMMCEVTGYKPGEFVHTFGDAHIYLDHIEQMKEQIKRNPKPLPALDIKKGVEYIDDFKMDDLQVKGYEPHSKIKGRVSV